MPVQYLLAGDASGVGALLGDFSSKETLLSVPFSPEQALLSSTWREMFVLSSFYTSDKSYYLRDKTVLHLSDNMGVRSIVAKGSGKPELAEMARAVFLAFRLKNIDLIVNWESREALVMQMADAGSRGPWLALDEFQMDFNSYLALLER